MIVAVPFWPEQRLAPQVAPLGAKLNELSSGAGWTETVRGTVCPIASWIVISTERSASTGFAMSTSVLPLIACETGSTDALLVKAEKGATPLVIVTEVGTPE